MTNHTDIERRLDALEGRLDRLTHVLEGIASTLGASAPLGGAIARAEGALSEVYGESAVTETLTEALVRLADPETLGSLVRLAELAPKLEYAAHFAAAGPELLEEGMEMAQHMSNTRALDPHELRLRKEVLAEAAVKLTERETVTALTELAKATPSIDPAVRAAADAVDALGVVEGRGQLQDRLTDALIRLADQETLESLLNLAELAPKLEYAAHFAAAGPELLEEGMELVQKLQGELAQDVPALGNLAALKPKLQDTTRLALKLTEVDPDDVDVPALISLVKSVTDPAHNQALQDIVKLSPQLGETLRALPVQGHTLALLSTINAAVEESVVESNSVGVFGMMGALRDPEVKRAAGFVVAVAQRLGRYLERPQLPAAAE